MLTLLSQAKYERVLEHDNHKMLEQRHAAMARSLSDWTEFSSDTCIYIVSWLNQYFGLYRHPGDLWKSIERENNGNRCTNRMAVARPDAELDLESACSLAVAWCMRVDRLQKHLRQFIAKHRVSSERRQSEKFPLL